MPRFIVLDWLTLRIAHIGKDETREWTGLHWDSLYDVLGFALANGYTQIPGLSEQTVLERN